MPRRGRPPGRRPGPRYERSCSSCGENYQGDGAGQLPGYFGHGNMGEIDGPEYYPDLVDGLPNGPRWGRGGNRGVGGTGPRGNINENAEANVWGVVNDNGFEVWNNGELVASGGDRLTRGAGRRGGDDVAFDFGDENYYFDDFDDFRSGASGRGAHLNGGGGHFGRGPRRRPGRFPSLDNVPPWFLDELNDGDFDDFEVMGALGSRPPRRRGRGPRRSGGGIRVTRQGSSIVVDNEFGGPPRGSGGQSGYGPEPDDEYDHDDENEDSGYDDEVVGNGFGGRNRDRILRFSDGATLRIYQG